IIEKLKTFCKKYKNGGYNIFLITQPPNWMNVVHSSELSLDEIYSVSKTFNVPHLLTYLNMTQQEWENVNNEKYCLFKKMEADGLVKVIDILPFFIHDGKCIFNDEYNDQKMKTPKEIHSYYYDEDHISSYGAKRLLEFILKTVYEEAEKKKQS
ncbi:MAG: SGNH hydrolase domain-containing protein, partial [Akkermansia sp.]